MLEFTLEKDPSSVTFVKSVLLILPISMYTKNYTQFEKRHSNAQNAPPAFIAKAIYRDMPKFTIMKNLTSVTPVENALLNHQ